MPKFDTTAVSTETWPDGFALTVPDHWARFDMSDAPFARARRDALRGVTSPAVKAGVNDLFRQARAINQAAKRRGALWGAGTATQYDDVMFLGHVMVFAISPGADVDMNLTTLTRQLSREADSTDANAPVGPRSVAPVTLPRYGEAVRVVATEHVTVAENAAVDMLTMHTLVLVPGSENDRLLITCCSPNVPLADEVYELFDAISATFRFTTSTDTTGTTETEATPTE
jgi:hypothetical protein